MPLLRAVIALVLLIVLTSPLAKSAVGWAWRKCVIKEPTRFTAKRQYATRATETLPSLGWWTSINEVDSLLRRLPPNVVLASSEYGYIGSQHPAVSIIDIVGLHDRHIARQGFSAHYLFSRMPDIIWLPHTDYTYARKEILDSKALWDNYDFYPNAYRYGLAVLRSSESSASIRGPLREEFSRIYSGRVMSDYRAEPLDALDGE